jgi:hypothetical protein
MSSYISCYDYVKNKTFIVGAISDDVIFSEQCKKIFENLKTTHLNSYECLDYIEENNEFTVYVTEKVTLQGWIYNTNKSVKTNIYKFSLIEIHNVFTDILKEDKNTETDDLNGGNENESGDLFESININTTVSNDTFSFFSDIYGKKDDTTVYLNDPFKIYYDFLSTHSVCNVYSQTEPNIIYDNTGNGSYENDNYNDSDSESDNKDNEIKKCNLIDQSPFIDSINKSLIRQTLSTPIDINTYNYYMNPDFTNDFFMNELREKLKLL